MSSENGIEGETDDFFLFAYGSLLWDDSDIVAAGAKVVGRVPAVLRECQRSLCCWSFHYRGSEEAPGLCMGLKRQTDHDAKQDGASQRDEPNGCHGVVLQIRPGRLALAACDAREMFSGAYTRQWFECSVPATKDGIPRASTIGCWAYVIAEDSRHYVPDSIVRDQEKAGRIIATSRGKNGPCIDYVRNVATKLKEAGMPVEDDLVAALAVAEKILAHRDSSS